MSVEVSVTIKNSEKKQTTKHLLYDEFTCSENDPLIKSLIDSSLEQFKDEPEDIRIKILLVVK